MENVAFTAAAGANRARLIQWGRTPAGAAPFFDAGQFRYIAAPLPLKGGRAVLLAGVPLERAPDPRMRALPGLFRFSGTLGPNASNLHRFIDRLVAADPALFRNAWLLASHGGRPFVPLHDVRGDDADSRSWLRWPFERLFDKRRAALIGDESAGAQALAVPFFVPPGERYVVLAPLRT
ncbi:MAG: hypothetical protein ABR508_04445, partial [Candidatus Baltobacteraceae bacterium]